MEKPLENTGFYTIFAFFIKMLPRQKIVSTGRSGTLYMEAWSAQHELPGRQNDSQELQNETRERQDGPSQCSIGYPDGLWQPALRPHMLLKANFNVPGSRWA